ncbi:hypothetical protein OH491_13715 [Termitidicoccus mucosus]|uniref:Uncharacterized protein n=1 Tax=Termitidicoccus mucosus TaxID=1184151 RepID=A0A178IHS8_9BACT|nr:hypothetical protein AW736_13740 [Opitutaceae bacterium TSB47]
MDTETTTPDTETPRWAIVELMGHIRYGGLVSKDTMFGTALLRIEVPTGETTFTTQLVNPSSLYRLTFCTEELARLAATSGQQKPISDWELANLEKTKALPELEARNNDDGEEADWP